MENTNSLLEQTVNIESKKGKILVVGDDPFILEMTKNILSRYYKNFDILTAKNGKEFREKANQEVCKLYITDYNLPDSTGLEILQERRRIGDNISAIIISGTEKEEELNAIQSYTQNFANHTAYFKKPFIIADVRSKINEVLDIQKQD